MNKKTILNLVAMSAILFIGLSIKAYAQASTSELINAEVLSNIWYSTTIINEKDNISIYAGFQNHSAKNLSGTASFLIDDIQISKVDFVASPKSLIKLETKYTALRGNHTAQIKIIDIKDIAENANNKLSIENLLAKESEKNTFSVKYEITKEEVLKKIEDVAINVLTTANTYAEELATNIENLKQPTDVSFSDLIKNPIQIVKEKTIGKVLGMSTENNDDTQTEQKDKSFSLKNIFLDAMAYVVRHWIWVFVAFVIAVVIFAFR